MADFSLSSSKLKAYEGGYSHHASDRGQETYRGVARSRHPFWPGWAIIDRLKEHSGSSIAFDMNAELQTAVDEFYRTEFWNVLWGDRLPSQAIADELFEQAVNFGASVAIRHLQRALNVLNNGGKRYDDVLVDGWMGGGTYAACNRCLVQSHEAHLLTVLKCLQGARYIEIMERDPSQEVFCLGWLSRV